MTELTRNVRQTGLSALAGLALAAAFIAGIVGGVVGARLVGNGQIAGNGAADQRVHAGQDVQAVPRITTADPKWIQYGQDWENRYRAMYPTTLDPKWVQYGSDWQRQYEQQHPTH